MKKTIKTAICIILVLAFSCTLLACSSKQEEKPDENVNVQQDTAADQTQQEIVPEPEDDTEIEEAPADKDLDVKIGKWEGVYKSENGSLIAIKDVDINSFKMTLAASDGVSFLTGFAEFDGDSAIFYSEMYVLVIDNKDDAITMVVEGENESLTQFAEEAGTFTKTEEDPYAVEEFVRTEDEEADGGADLGADFHIKEIDGERFLNYIEPAGLYSVIFPDLFSAMPGDMQLENGVYLVQDGADTPAHITIESMEQESLSPEELAEYLSGQYENGKATVLDDGKVVFEYSYTDGRGMDFTEVIFLRSTGSLLVKVNFVFAASEYDTFSRYFDYIDISLG